MGISAAASQPDTLQVTRAFSFTLGMNVVHDLENVPLCFTTVEFLGPGEAVLPDDRDSIGLFRLTSHPQIVSPPCVVGMVPRHRQPAMCALSCIWTNGRQPSRHTAH